MDREYIIGPKRVLRYGDKALILIPKPLVNKLGGKLVELRVTIIENEEEKQLKVIK